MPLKPLEVLKKGLNNYVKAKKEKLRSQLAGKKSISSQEERWLDQEANLVDEQRVLEAEEEASDYERGLGKLDDKQKGVVRKLRELAGDISKVIGNKRKRTSGTAIMAGSNA